MNIERKLLVIAGLTSLLMMACQSEELVIPVDSQNNVVVEFTDAELATLFQMRGDSHKVDVSEAEEFANDVIGFLDGDVSTRATSPRRISSVTALPPSQDMSEVVTRTIDEETVEIPDTIAYLFNFDDNAGYAIVSGDKRIQSPILTYCTDGNLTGEIDNPGLIGILMETEGYIINSIIDYENRIDSIKNDILEKLLPDSLANTRLPLDNPSNQEMESRIYDVNVTVVGGGNIGGPTTNPETVTTTTTTYGNWETTERLQPLLPVEWNQKFPFNARVKNKHGSTNAPAGCVVVALAQIMTYWGHPASIYNYRFNWPLLRSYTARPNKYPNTNGKKLFHNYETDNTLLDNNAITVDEQNFVSEVSTLMEIIGIGTFMDYSDTGSGASDKDAMNFLSSYGYNTGDYLMDYNYNKVIQSLNNLRPVFATGYSKKIQHRIKLLGITIGTWSEHGEGHTWVIDGYLNQRQAKIVQITVKNRLTQNIVSQTTTTTYSYAKYLHHNWGWEAQGYPPKYYNGYFVEGSYNSNDKRLESDTRATVTYEEGNFRFLKEIVPNIRPN
ncbi:C10 family peptidase [Bacteroides sp. UBA939]|uniref:C10 family peptidase n=1 Tax=Bacteroides sp. UBA939 TaxID=1946092 RepID=UPI0025C61AC4|nr:C10 family peptidase [Bacteroides sp. UBA939]